MYRKSGKQESNRIENNPDQNKFNIIIKHRHNIKREINKWKYSKECIKNECIMFDI